MKNHIYWRSLCVCLLLSIFSLTAQAALMSHFQGRYGAIEVWDSGKKLSFRVNAPELSTARGFCQTQNLNLVIAALEAGVMRDINKKYTQVLGGKDQTQTLKVALMRQSEWVFTQLKAELSQAQIDAFGKSKAAIASCPASAFQILEWFKNLQNNSLPLKPNTKVLLKNLLRTKTGNGRVMYNLVSRSAESTGAVGGAFGFVEIKGQPPIFYAVSVDGKSVPDLYGVARSIRDKALFELHYWEAVSTEKAALTTEK